ncbi:MAG: terminase family protein [Pseudomonadota bacterium]
MMRNSAPTWSDWWDEKFKCATVLERRELELLHRFPFLATARNAQRSPRGAWRTWLFVGGRGAGKTRAGAEWTRFGALFGQCARTALIGPTLGDVREVMIEGPSGLRSIETYRSERPTFNVSRRRLEWPNGAIASVFSADDPESLRGPQFDAAWCDEIAIWPYAEQAWNNLQFGLRLGAAPRCLATTTPRPVPLVRRLMAGNAVVTHSTTQDNSNYLAPGFVEDMTRTYAGTALARQELEGLLIEDIEGALWRRSDIEAHRVRRPPERFIDIIVAIDPPTTHHQHSDACGIVAVGSAQAEGFGEKAFVLADASTRGFMPSDWAARALALARDVGASRIVAEANQGGEMVRTVLRGAGCDLPIDLVHARLGKRARAIPIAASYAQGRVSHVGVFPDLEDEMCRFGTDSFTGSPDRVDALVWGLSTVLRPALQAPRIRMV